MADKKISALTAATTPLAGSEVLPIVQSGATVKVSVDNLTAGKAVSASSVTATNIKTSPATASLDISGTTIAAAGSNADVDVNINAKGTGVAYLNQRWGVNASGALVASAGNTYDIGNGAANPRDVNVDRNVIIKGSSTGTTAIGSLNSSATNYTASFPAANTNIPIAAQVLTFSGPSAARTVTFPDANFTAARTDAAQSFTGDQTLSTGNLVIGTSGKGIDFSATASGSGTMTGELLSDYEEGTWTPTWSVGGGTIAAIYNEGFYTKIGRQVFVGGYIAYGGSTTGSPTGPLSIAGLPFTSEATGYGQSGNRQAGRGIVGYNFWGSTPTVQSLGMANNSTLIGLAASYSDMSLGFTNSDQLYFFMTYFT